MAYVSQEMKKELAPGIKAVLNKYGVKGSIAVRNHMTLVVNIKSGDVDFARGKNDAGFNRGMTASDDGFYDQVNTSHISKFYNDTAAAFLTELVDAMKQPTVRGDWYNNTDIMTDYFDIAYYIDINVGQWDKGYIYNGEETIAA
jgi:hypothetical protein